MEKIFNQRKYLYVLFVIVFIGVLLIITSCQNNEVQASEEKNSSISNISKDEVEKVVIPKKIKVDIKGLVATQGVYELEENSRVIDAINMAGGLLEGANTRSLNLSKILKDENVIIIENKQEPEKIIEYVYQECNCPKVNDACLNNKDVVNFQEENKVENDNESNEENKLVSLNSATTEEIQSLPGIGEAKAKAIINYRDENGFFQSIDDIKNVSGIGEALFEKIKDYITL